MNFEFERQETPLFPEVEFNRPERKLGRLGLIGGRDGALVAASRAYELADTLGPAEIIRDDPAGCDAVLVLGDLDKNAAKIAALTEQLEQFIRTNKPLVITRDAVDLLLDFITDHLDAKNLTVICTFTQLQKIFRAVLYPKVLVMSLPLLTLAETLHKFTLSYEASLAIVFGGQFLVASNGRVVGTDLEITRYNPLTIWSGELATRATVNLLQQNSPLASLATAVLQA